MSQKAKKGKALNFLNRDAILGMDDRKQEEVFVPEWDGTVIIKAMSGKERDAWETAIVDAQESGAEPNVRARLVAGCAYDGEGNRLFTMEDADKLGEKSAKALNQLFTVAQELSGIGVGAVEEMEKNS